MSTQVREKLAKCVDLPSLPAVAIQILSLCHRDEPDMGQIAKLISSDPALTAKILRLTNSPMYGLKNEIRSVSHAICLLGLSAIRPLALSFSLVNGLKSKDKKAFTWFWKRSLMTAVAARELAQAKGFRLVEEAFMAGLLQDIGILALRQLVGTDYASIAREGVRHDILAEAEMEVFGEDHASIGGWLTERWKLPAILCTAITYSHTPEKLPANIHADIRLLVEIVAVAAEVADVWIEADAVKATESLRLFAFRILGIDDQRLDLILQTVGTRSLEVARYFELEIGSTQELSVIADQAKETLLMLALSASQQAMNAQEAIGSLEAKTRTLEQEVRQDALTGLFNRGYFDQVFGQAVAMVKNNGTALSVLLIDIDHFKNVNDTYGHPVGDMVLKKVASIISMRLRPTDFCARYGGEEFVILLPGSPASGAEVVAERVRRQVAEAVLDMGGTSSRVTISIGRATLIPSSSMRPEELLKAVDQALYEAKHAGRNCVMAA
jgi:diguanylate cyclase (GGDEF)-like protein